MLNKNSQLEMLKALEKASSTFTLDDFDVDFSNNQSKAIITFKHESGYSFDVQFKERFEYTSVSGSNFLKAMRQETRQEGHLSSSYDVQVCPGKESLHETWYERDLYSVIHKIDDWITYLDKELSVDELLEEKQELAEKKERIKASIALHLEPYIDNRDLRFKSDEIIEIKEKFSDLIHALEEDNALLVEEIERLKIVVAEVSQSLTKFKKGTWFEIATNQMASWATGLENTQKLIDAVKQLGSNFS
ncbi:hypothetical protein VP758_000876 [Vibrio harveyi]|nr:hypothetical protein [Vibrio harveyi]